MKKLLALLLALCMLFSVATLFAGCEESGKKKASSYKNDDDEDEEDEDDEDDKEGEGDPSDPSNPSDPSDPSDPSNPADPSAPTDPANPEDPQPEPTEDAGDPDATEPTVTEPTEGTWEPDPTDPAEPATTLEQIQESMDIYLEIVTKKDLSRLELLVPEAFWSENGYTLSQIRTAFPAALDKYLAGGTMDARCEILSYESLDSDAMDTVTNYLVQCGLDADKVEAGASVVCNTYSNMNGQIEENKATMCAVCYDGRWYTMISEYNFSAEFVLFVMDVYAEGIEKPSDDDEILEGIQTSMDIYLEIGTGKGLTRMEQLAPAVYWENCGYDLDYIYANFAEAYDFYTDGVAMQSTCVVTSYELLDDDTLENMMDNLAHTGMDPAKAEACALVQSHVVDIIDGEEDAHEQEFYAICYDGVWYAMITESTLFADFVLYVMNYYAYAG